jgi:hypothetical protein
VRPMISRISNQLNVSFSRKFLRRNLAAPVARTLKTRMRQSSFLPYAARQTFESNCRNFGCIPDSCCGRLFLRNVVCTRGKLVLSAFPQIHFPIRSRPHQGKGTSNIKGQIYANNSQIIRNGTHLSIISARCSLKAQWRGGGRYTRLHHLRDIANVMECSLLAPCQLDGEVFAL